MDQKVPLYSTNTVPHKNFNPIKGKGAIFWECNGQEVIDLSSQTVNLLFGQRHPKIHQSVVNQLGKITFIDEDFHSSIHYDAMKKLYKLLPKDLTVLNIRMNDASSAVECAIKQAKKYTKKTTILTCDGIYLGQNTQTISIRGWGESRKEILRGSSENVIFGRLPYNFEVDEQDKYIDNVIDEFENIVKENHMDLACVLLDPVMISAGICMAPTLQKYITAANKVSKAYNVPFILDESQSYGWVPDVTLSKHWDLDVDALILGKGVAGGFPLAVCASKPYLDGLMRGDADYTHGGHPISVAALSATCDLIDLERDKFAITAQYLEHLLNKKTKNYKYIFTHGLGLIRAVQINKYNNYEKDKKIVEQVADLALKRGVYVRKYGKTLGIKPPRSITKQQLYKSINILFETINEVVDKY